MALAAGGKLWEGSVGFVLVPVGHRADVISQRLIDSVGPPAQRLHRHPQVLIKADRVHNVPAIQPVLGYLALFPMVERIAQEGR